MSGSPAPSGQGPRPIVPKGRPRTARLKSAMEGTSIKWKSSSLDPNGVAVGAKRAPEKARVCGHCRATGHDKRTCSKWKDIMKGVD